MIGSIWYSVCQGEGGGRVKRNGHRWRGRKGYAVAPLSQVHSDLKKALQKARLSFRLCVHPWALCQGQEGKLRPRGVGDRDGSPSSLALPPLWSSLQGPAEVLASPRVGACLAAAAIDWLINGAFNGARKE